MFNSILDVLMAQFKIFMSSIRDLNFVDDGVIIQEGTSEVIRVGSLTNKAGLQVLYFMMSYQVIFLAGSMESNRYLNVFKHKWEKLWKTVYIFPWNGSGLLKDLSYYLRYSTLSGLIPVDKKEWQELLSNYKE